ncbi:unnamed protein product [Protopolystoma xenopodis]|uniref:Uncharacterized protein n=1 Tax=Protopolystoma xenopodis TaxID=117903 RepID=A0A3S5BDW2_9PLAT|nr:unnamed protein product [Protopolystoma xenopodis]
MATIRGEGRRLPTSDLFVLNETVPESLLTPMRCQPRQARKALFSLEVVCLKCPASAGVDSCSGHFAHFLPTPLVSSGRDHHLHPPHVVWADLVCPKHPVVPETGLFSLGHGPAESLVRHPLGQTGTCIRSRGYCQTGRGHET